MLTSLDLITNSARRDQGMSSTRIHEITLPVKVVVGYSVIDKITDYLEKTGLADIHNAGIVTGENTYRVAGSRIKELLSDKGYDVTVWKVKRPDINTAEEIAREARRHGIKLVLGVGGGKSIDLAKYAAYKNNGYMISVPTAASHDGIASPFASLKGLDRPTSIHTVTPYAIIADIEVISKAPPRLLRSGVGDLLGKLVAVKDWRLAHRLRNEYYGEYAAQLALMSAKHVIRYYELIASGSPEGVRVVVEALISSGVAMCIAGSSRPASGSEHLFGHAIEILAPGKVLHGEAVALGTVLMLYLYGDPMWKRIRRIMKRIGLPTTARELGLPPETLVEALTMAHKIRPERYTILGDRGLTREAAWNLLRETGVV
jgi:glycerol-1-phosphate dehydrogenase [NAD(P)+]